MHRSLFGTLALAVAAGLPCRALTAAPIPAPASAAMPANAPAAAPASPASPAPPAAPADLAGSWRISTPSREWPQGITLRLAHQEGRLGGELVGVNGVRTPLANVSFADGRLRFSTDPMLHGQPIHVEVSGVFLQGDLTGDVRTASGATHFTAVRESAFPGVRFGRGPTPSVRPVGSAGAPAAPAASTEPAVPSVTHHTATIGGRALHYTATAGLMPLTGPDGQVDARIFYVSYTLDGTRPANRPLLFAFNGGPGSSSVWLHLGAIGPRRVELRDDGSMPPPPFRLHDNGSSWLDLADLVFIDPVGTGYSQSAKPGQERAYWGVHQDIESISEFIRLYLTRNERWSSPLFLAGESYGTFRAAGLASDLEDKGIALNGVILISTVLNFGLITGMREEASALDLPSYAAIAWYHHRLPPDLQRRTLADLLPQVEHWASTTYLQALQQGDALTARESTAVAKQLARYSGLSQKYVEESNLRIDPTRFRKQLLRDRRRIIGRYDARVTGIDPDAAGESPTYDPSDAAVSPPFTMAFNQYIRTELGYKTDRDYHILNGLPWDFGVGQMGYPETASALRSALTRNRYLRVFVAMGVYDLATPYYTVEYTLHHLELDPSRESHISTAKFEGGHMIYTNSPNRRALKADVAAFMKQALSAAR